MNNPAQAKIVSLSWWRDLFFVLALASYNVTDGQLNGYRFVFWGAIVAFLYLAALERLGCWTKERCCRGVPARSLVLLPILWFAVFASYCLLSSNWAVFPYAGGSSMYYSNFLYVLILFIGLAVSVTTHDEAVRYLRLVFFGACLSGFAAILVSIPDGLFSVRLGAALDLSPNALGLQAGFAFGFAIFLPLLEGRTRPFIDFIGLTILCAVILLSDSRKAMIMVVVLLAVRYVYSKRELIDVRKVATVAVVLTLFLVAVFSIPFLKDTIGYRLSALFTGLNSDGSVDYSLTERNYYKDEAMRLFQMYPAFGVGLDGFAGYLASINYWHVAYSHCNYTELLCSLGIVGFILFYVFHLRLFILSAAAVKNGSLEGYIGMTFVVLKVILDYGYVSFYMADDCCILFLLYALVRHSAIAAKAASSIGLVRQ